MPSRALPNLGLQAFFDLGEGGWDDEMSLNLLLLSVLVQGGVLEMVSATPGSPSNGDVYLFSETHPTQANKVAIRDAGAWIYVTPLEGWRLYDRNANLLRLFNGTAWVSYSPVSLYFVPFGFAAKPTDGEDLFFGVFTDSVSFPANWSGSRASIGTTPTATASLEIRKNGSVVGTISISTAGVATFATTGGSAVNFVAGDSISVKAQATADATLANSAFTLRGTRS
jgi:hypothetical protein